MGETAGAEAWRGLRGGAYGDGWTLRLGGPGRTLCCARLKKLRLDLKAVGSHGGKGIPGRCGCYRTLLGSGLLMDPRKWSRGPKKATKETELESRLLSLLHAHAFPGSLSKADSGSAGLR